jgi:hypothetical protein
MPSAGATDALKIVIAVDGCLLTKTASGTKTGGFSRECYRFLSDSLPIARNLISDGPIALPRLGMNDRLVSHAESKTVARFHHCAGTGMAYDPITVALAHRLLTPNVARSNRACVVTRRRQFDFRGSQSKKDRI